MVEGDSRAEYFRAYRRGKKSFAVTVDAAELEELEKILQKQGKTKTDWFTEVLHETIRKPQNKASTTEKEPTKSPSVVVKKLSTAKEAKPDWDVEKRRDNEYTAEDFGMDLLINYKAYIREVRDLIKRKSHILSTDDGQEVAKNFFSVVKSEIIALSHEVQLLYKANENA